MNHEIKTDAKSRFLDSLLSQEQPVSSSVYQEYQAMLEQKLNAAERKIRRSRIETATIFGAAILCGAIGWFAETLPLPDSLYSLRLCLGCIGLSGIVFAYWGCFRLFRYFVIDRRAVDLARDESRDAVMLELTRKVDALAQRFESLSAQK